jgi:hypothetical protein
MFLVCVCVLGGGRCEWTGVENTKRNSYEWNVPPPLRYFHVISFPQLRTGPKTEETAKSSSELTNLNPLVTVCTLLFNIKKLCIMSTDSLYRMHHVMHHYIILLYDRQHNKFQINKPMLLY